MAHTTVAVPTRTLVLGVARRDGSIRAEDVYRVADASGQTKEQVRSCLRRLVREGLYERNGSGRDAVYRPTAVGAATLGARLRRVRLSFAQDAAGRGWDRHWRLVAFAVPEVNRSSRDALRDRLRELGGAPIQGGLYVSPHPWESDVRAAAAEFGIQDHLTLAATDELEALRLNRGRVSDAELFPRMLAMGVDHDEISGLDPFLPPELLPRPWTGRSARELVIRCRRLAHQVRESGTGTGLFDNYDSFVLDL